MLTFKDLHDTDLRQVTGPGESFGAAEVLVHVEAELSVTDDGQVIYAEAEFPVVELARDLRAWMRTDEHDRDEYAFGDDSGFPEAGAVRIARAGGGWRIGSVFEPDSWSRTLTTRQLDHALTAFVTEVIEACRAQLGIDVAELISAARLARGLGCLVMRPPPG